MEILELKANFLPRATGCAPQQLMATEGCGPFRSSEHSARWSSLRIWGLALAAIWLGPPPQELPIFLLCLAHRVFWFS